VGRHGLLGPFGYGPFAQLWITMLLLLGACYACCTSVCDAVWRRSWETFGWISYRADVREAPHQRQCHAVFRVRRWDRTTRTHTRTHSHTRIHIHSHTHIHTHTHTVWLYTPHTRTHTVWSSRKPRTHTSICTRAHVVFELVELVVDAVRATLQQCFSLRSPCKF